MDKEQQKQVRAYVIGSYLNSKEKEQAENYLEELKSLCHTYGFAVEGGQTCSLKKIDAATFLGKGKLEEIAQNCSLQSIEVVIFDDEITPNQQRNLEALLKIRVMDRTELIIEVFAQRAHTREARLQVELAKTQYQLPRLRRMWTHLSRESSGSGAGGGGYLRGTGEQQIEIDRRLARKRIDQLRKEIEAIRDQRQVQRQQRLRKQIPTFAIIGYTNAGKSSLLNKLTQANVLAEDKLFATLDTTTRKYLLPNKQEVLLVDTVGFIRKIPHTLVAAFKSTLEEAVHTDILIHVVDVSHPQAFEQAEATEAVLKELKADHYPRITLLNKMDQCEDKSVIYRFQGKYPRSIPFSITESLGFDTLLERMEEGVKSLRQHLLLHIPQSQYGLVAELIQAGRLISIDYDKENILLDIELPGILLYKAKNYIIKSL